MKANGKRLAGNGTLVSRQPLYAGTIGAPCDVVLAINAQEVSDRVTIVLPSGATLRVGRDGAWLCDTTRADPRQIQRGIDSFQYTLQTPAGVVTGRVDILPQPQALATGLWRRPNTAVGESIGEGAASDPVRLRVPMTTGAPLHLELRSGLDDKRAHDRAVVLLEHSTGVAASVLPDGVVCVQAAAGHQGPASLLVLVETETGRSEWVAVELDVLAACTFDDTRNRSPDRRAAQGSSVLSKVTRKVIPHRSTLVFRGTCRPGTQLLGRLETTAGEITSRALADAAGYWSMTFRGASTGCPCNVTIEEPVGQFGALQVYSPAAGGYRELL